MVTITHVRFGGSGTAPDDVVLLRWRASLGDSNVADMIEWIEAGGVARVYVGEREHQLAVVREAGRGPYLTTVAGGTRTDTIAALPRF